jgi:hypothetical protein
VPVQQLGYPWLALKEGHPYLIQIWWDTGMTWCHSLPTLSEAIEFCLGSMRAALYAVDEPISGLAVQRLLADVAFGEWHIVRGQEELTMAKVKAVQKGKGKRDVVEDLIGDSKPKKKTGKAVKAAKVKADKNGGGRGRTSKYDDDTKIRILKKYEGREGSNATVSFGVLKTGMRLADWQKARKKAGVENPGTGVLRNLINDGYLSAK